MTDRIAWEQRLTTAALVVASVGFLLVVWWSRPPASTEYPKAMQDGLSLLLAALVFVLGFARETQSRTVESALESFADGQESQLDAWQDRSKSGPTSGDLMNLALRRASDVGAFRRLATELRSEGTRKLVTLSRRRERPEDEYRNVSLLLAYREMALGEAERRESERGSEVSRLLAQPEKKLVAFRKQIPKLRADLDRLKPDVDFLREAAGVGTAELVTGPARIRLATSSLVLMQNAGRFAAGMGLLYVAGVIHAGPSLVLLSSPSLWVATLVIVVAVTYVGLVNRNVENDVRFAADSVDQQPLVVLAALEGMLCHPDWNSADEAITRVVKAWKDTGWWLLRLVEVQAPGLPWTDSVRGRFELALALDAGTDSTRQRHERSHYLDLAERHLRRADDPLGLAALARVLEERGDERDVASLVTTAAHLLGETTPVWQPGEGWDRTLTVVDLFDGQWWLWPTDPDAVAVLHDAAGPGIATDSTDGNDWEDVPDEE